MPTFFEFFGFFHQNGVIGKVNQCYLLLRLKDKWDGSRPNKMTLRFARITRTVKPRKTHKRVGRKADFLWRENHQDGGSGHNGMQLEVKRLVKFVVPAVRFHCLVYRANFLAIFCMGCRAIIRSLSIVWCWLFRCRPWNMFPCQLHSTCKFSKGGKTDIDPEPTGRRFGNDQKRLKLHQILKYKHMLWNDKSQSLQLPEDCLTHYGIL